MKAYICDQCGAQQEPEKNYDAPPVGWFTISRRSTTNYTNQHFCSIACATEGVRAAAPVPAAEAINHG